LVRRSLHSQFSAALERLLSDAIDRDRYPLSPLIKMLKGILAKIRPEPKRDPLPPPKHMNHRGRAATGDDEILFRPADTGGAGS